MNKLALTLFGVFSFLFCFSQTCMQPVAPENGIITALMYDHTDTVPTNHTVYNNANGLELKWRQVAGQKFLNYSVFIKKDGDASFVRRVYNAGTYGKTSDTSILYPFEYNKKYDWFVSLNNASYSLVTPPCAAMVYSFTTLPAPTYCKPGCIGAYDDDYRSGFKIGLKGANNSNNALFGAVCHYFNRTTSNVAELMQGKSSQFLFWHGQPLNLSSWIDFNDNGYFESAECVISKLKDSKSYYYNGVVFTDSTNGSVFIPQTATLGIHRIRVVQHPLAAAYSIEPCMPANAISDGYVKIIPSDNKEYGLAELATANTCLQTTLSSISAVANNNNEWVPLVDFRGKIVASIKANNNDLGTITVLQYKNSGAIRTLPSGVKVMDRSIEITPEFQPTTPVDVRLYFSKSEFDALKAADNSLTLANLNISKFSSGCGQTAAGYNFIGQSSAGVIDSFYYIQFSTSSFSNFFLRAGSEATLPVSLVSLSAKRVGVADAIVQWETATEAGNKGFEVQYSTDGLSFNKLASIASLANGGNSNVSLLYRYKHIGVSLAKVFYRIKQIENDGKETFSTVVTVAAFSGVKTSIISATPNPVNQYIDVAVEAVNSENVIIQVTDMTGINIQQQKASLSPGNNKIRIQFNGLSSGIYLLMLKNINGEKIGIYKFNKL